MFGSTKSIERPSLAFDVQTQSPPVGAGGFSFLGQLPETHNYPSLIKPNNSALPSPLPGKLRHLLFMTRWLAAASAATPTGMQTDALPMHLLAGRD